MIPNKPIRYGVISHHHFDHTGGLAAVVAEGITIVTPEVNEAFLEQRAERARARSRPMPSRRAARQPMVEGFEGDKRVFQDATRTFEIHVIKGLPHADGLVVGYLPAREDPGLRRHVQPAAGGQPGAQSAGRRHAACSSPTSSGSGCSRSGSCRSTRSIPTG